MCVKVLTTSTIGLNAAGKTPVQSKATRIILIVVVYTTGVGYDFFPSSDEYPKRELTHAIRTILRNV